MCLWGQWRLRAVCRAGAGTGSDTDHMCRKVTVWGAGAGTCTGAGAGSKRGCKSSGRCAGLQALVRIGFLTQDTRTEGAAPPYYINTWPLTPLTQMHA